MKTLIFDFDGTIADSFETLLGIFEQITSRPEKLTAVEIKRLRGSSLKQIMKYLDIKSWQVPLLVLKAKRQISLKITGIHAFDGMPESLNKLHRNGYQLIILSTNSTTNIEEFLKKNNLDKIFTKIYGNIGLRSKSSALKKIIHRENLNIAQCFYIGDEVRDIEAAKKAGIKCIAVAWGFNYPAALKKAKPYGIAKQPKDIQKYLTS